MRKTTEIKVNRTFSQDEYEKLKIPLLPESMDNKWKTEFKDNVLSFYRSWTGICIYEVYFEEMTAVKAAINNDKYQNIIKEDNYNIMIIDFIIHNLILGKPIKFPIRKQDYDNTPRGLFQHQLIGTNYPESVISFKE